MFATGEFASLHPDVLRSIESRGHQIGVSGWQKGEDLSLLGYEEQLATIRRSFEAVRAASASPDSIVDFKPQGYKFNDDTIQALQDFGATSIVATFQCDAAYCQCAYAQSLGEITFPYPISTEFWAVPISSTELGPGGLPLDDTRFVSLTDQPDGYLSQLIQTYTQHQETKDPLTITVHPSIMAGSAEALDALDQFLAYVESNNGKNAPLYTIRHHTAYFTAFDATGPSEAASGENVTIDVAYTSNLYCPKYRVRAYGRYPGQEWKLLDSECQFVQIGDHSLNLQAEIPKPPEGEDKYSVRVVGKASFGTCDLSDPNWPTYDSYEVVDDLQIDVKEYKYKVLMVPLRDWGRRPG